MEKDTSAEVVIKTAHKILWISAFAPLVAAFLWMMYETEVRYMVPLLGQELLFASIGMYIGGIIAGLDIKLRR